MSIVITVTFPATETAPPKRAFLCRDGKLRSWPIWGNTYLCLKTYRSWGWAERITEQLKTRFPSAASVTASRIFEGDTFDAQGRLVRGPAGARDLEVKPGTPVRMEFTANL